MRSWAVRGAIEYSRSLVSNSPWPKCILIYLNKVARVLLYQLALALPYAQPVAMLHQQNLALQAVFALPSSRS